jgi:hypothetical protein
MDCWERRSFFGLRSDFRIALRQWYVSGWGKLQYIDIRFFSSTKIGATHVRLPYFPTWTMVLRIWLFNFPGAPNSSDIPWHINLTVSSVFCKLYVSMIDNKNHVKADWFRSVSKLKYSKFIYYVCLILTLSVHKIITSWCIVEKK